MRALLFLFFGAFPFGCQQSQQPVKTETAAPVAPAATVARTTCYELVQGRTVLNARLTFTGDTVTGQLNYLFAEKDQSRGTVKGLLKGDVLKADYTFQSEGRQSVMEVLFKLEGDKLVQGHGPMGEYNGKIIYLFPDKAEFTTPFKAVPCSN